MKGRMDSAVFAVLNEAVPYFLSGLDKSTGKFLPTRFSGSQINKLSYTIYDQSPHYPLALLYKTKDSRNPYYGDKRLFAAAVKGASFLADSQDKKGNFRLFSGGKDWGSVHLNWQVYHWQRTYELLRDELEPKARKRWEACLRLAVGGIKKDITDKYLKTGILNTGYNHFLWYLLCIAKNGELLCDRKLISYAASAFKKTAPTRFDGGGLWVDGEPDNWSIGYNSLSMHAMSLLKEITQDGIFEKYLRKTLPLMANFSYGAADYIETLDSRMRNGFHDAWGLNSFLSSKAYGRISCLVVEKYLARMRSGEPWMKLNINVPLIADLLGHPGGRNIFRKLPFERKNYSFREGKGRALVRRHGDWQYSLSAFCAKGLPDNVFRLEAQSHVSAYNHRTGLVIGGGNSKNQPAFSNFTFSNGKDYRAKTGSLKGSKLRLNYESGSAEIEAKIAGKEVIIRTSATGQNSLTGLQLQALLGDRVQINGRKFALGRKSLRVPLEKRVNSLVIKGKAKLIVPSGGVFVWPVKPHNPYTADNKTAPDGWVSFIYLKNSENTVRVRM